jgi:predicted nucleic acid-binding protein
VTEEVYLDSGAFIAFLLRSDVLHDEVAGMFARPPRRWCTSAFVVAETYSWFVHRLGEGAARTLRSLLDSLTDLEVLEADSAHMKAAWGKLDELRGLKLTYVDASSLVWLQERRIKTVWGTDQHLAVEGARVMPGSPTR